MEGSQEYDTDYVSAFTPGLGDTAFSDVVRERGLQGNQRRPQDFSLLKNAKINKNK